MESFAINNTKQFMSLLLVKTTFDDFYFESGKITTFNTFSIDGWLRKDFFGEEDIESNGDEKYVKYSMIRPYLYELIKGKRTPVSFQMILHAPHDFYENGDFETGVRYILNVRFEEGKLCCISAISRSEFTLDKTSDMLWDKKISKFIDDIIS